MNDDKPQDILNNDTLDTPDTCAVIVAGGIGQRFGLPEGKQFVDMCGLPMVAWSMKAFDKAPSVGAMVLVLGQDKLDHVQAELLDELSLTKPVILACAGDTRQESVHNGLMAVPKEFQYVSIHDGARPLILPEVIEGSLRPLRENIEIDGVVCGQPCIDTLKLVDGNEILSTPNRANYWTVQTPQNFRRDKILSVHEWAQESDVEGTDDASLVERYGANLICFESPRDNIKVTVPEDLKPASAILQERLDLEAQGGCSCA